MGVPAKLFFVGGFALVAIGIILAALVGMGGHRNVAEGMEGMHCSGATLLDVTLSGSENSDDGFSGVLDLLRQMDNILDALSENSQFMTKLRALLDETEPLERSVKMLTGTLTLLDETMALPDNLRPKSSSGEDLDHICHFCEAMAGSVAPMSKEIEDSVATALDKARGEVKYQLSGQKLVDLRKNMDDGIEPLRDAKDSLRDSISPMTDGDIADAINGIVELIGLVVLALFAIAIPILCCDGCAVGCAAFKPRTKSADDYSKAPSRCACCGWCFGWVLAFIGLFLGGLLMTAMSPVSNVCLVMMDVNKENLQDWGPALGMETGTKAFEDTINIIDECMGQDGAGKLMEVIMVDDDTSLRKKLEDDTRGSINKQFDDLVEKSKTQTTSMSDTKGFKDLLDFLGSDVSQLTTFDPTRIASLTSKPEFAGFAAAPEVSKKAFSTSASCNDFTIDKSGVLKDVKLDGTIPGLNSLKTDFESKGLSTPCSSKCDCDFTSGPMALRTAANSIMKTKRDLRESNLYKCNLFRTEVGQTCDPKDFKTTGKSCVRKDADGKLKMVTKEIKCTYPEFVQYVKDFKKRIEVATEELEVQSNALVPTISLGLKDLVNEELLDKMFVLVDNVNCKFIGNAYWGMVDALCHQAARGMSEMSTAFAVMGGLVLGLVILMYITYRRVVDNIEISRNQVQPASPPPVNPVVPVGNGNF